MEFEKIVPMLQNGIKPDCERCKKKQGAFVHHPIADLWVCGDCYVELENRKQNALKKLILE